MQAEEKGRSEGVVFPATILDATAAVLLRLHSFSPPFMKPFQCGALLLAVSLISGCSDDMRSRFAELLGRFKPVAASAEPAPAQELLAQLTSLDAIGLNLAYVEKLAGPPVRSESHQHHFKVQGCQLVLHSDDQDKAIRAVQIAVTPDCEADVSGLLGQQKPLPLRTLTFGSFDEATTSGRYLADCLRDCGNGYLPSIHLIVEGSRAMQFQELMLSVPLVDAPVLEAKDQWADTMAAKETEDWVLQGGFNCQPQRYRDAAAQALRNLRPGLLSFGGALEYPKCMSAATAVTAAATVAVSTAAPASASAGMVAVPQPGGACDMDYGKRLKAAGLLAKEVSVHGPEDQDFAGYGCAYRITPVPGSQVPVGSAVSYRSAWEAG